MLSAPRSAPDLLSPSPRQARRTALAQAAALLAIALPWVQPFSAGPSVSVVPWLITLYLTALLALVTGLGRLPAGLLAAGGAFAGWVAIRGNGGLETFGAIGAVGLVLLAAASGALLGRDREGVRLLARAWLAAAAIGAAIALWQYLGLAQDGGLWISAASPGEAFGNLRQRNQAATLCVIGLCALAWLQADGLRLRLALPLVVLLAAADAATTSRNGLLQGVLLAVACVALAGARRRQALVLAASGLAAYAAAAVLLPMLLAARGLAVASLFDRVAGVASCSSRKVLWSNVLDLIAQRPVLGWGWGELDYAHYTTLYPGPRFCDILDNAHNLPLHLAVELGLPAALLALGVAAVAVARLAPWRESDAGRHLAWAVLAALALHSAVEYPLWYGPFQVAAGLAIGLLCAHRAAPVAVWGRAAVPALALAVAAYGGWDYWRVSQAYLPPALRAPAYADDTLAKVRGSRLFRDHVAFADLTTRQVDSTDPVGAAALHAAARALLHFSPEPRVIERAIDSARVLGLDEEARREDARLRAAFPDDHARRAARIPAID